MLDLLERQKTFTTEFSTKSITEYFVFSFATHTEEYPRKPPVIPGVAAPGKFLRLREERRIGKRTDPKNILYLVRSPNSLSFFFSCSVDYNTEQESSY